MRPSDGGCAVDVEGAMGAAVVTESVSEVHHLITSALDEGKDWIELTTIADPDEEMDRRPCWMRPDKIICLTYVPPEQLEKWETEIA